MIKDPTFIHIGMPKTATTFLQNKVFPYLPGVAYLGRQEASSAVDIFAREICHMDRLNENKKRLLDLQYKCVSGVNRSLPLLLSVEDFSCSRTSLLTSETRGERCCDRSIIAMRLKELFPNSRIIITIRNHRSVMRSIYNFTILRNQKYITPEKWFSANTVAGGMLETFCYYNMIKFYQTTFGRGHVLVLPYEMLMTNPNIFFKNLFSYINVDYVVSGSVTDKKLNSSTSIEKLKYYKFKHDAPTSVSRLLGEYLTYKISQNFDLNSHEQSVTSAIEQHIDFFGDDRSSLLRYFPKLALESLGY